MSSDRIDALSRSLADGTSRRSLLRMLGIGVAGTAIAGTAVTQIGLDDAQAKTFSKLKNLPVKGRDGDKRFRGELSVREFKQVGQEIVAVAKLTGTVTEDGKKKRVSKTVELPVSFPGVAGLQAEATCEILDLVLGPLDLRLLGLRLQINRIHIRLTAQQGGGLLGDLLCAIANLLNGGNVLGQLTQIVGLLNQILAAL
ncbi:MAG: hypothetical protein K0S78_6405 [Thermomicrobiales bacterium]|nr:hypothetical protein [Thermomicrobiales bacterium]